MMSTVEIKFSTCGISADKFCFNLHVDTTKFEFCMIILSRLTLLSRLIKSHVFIVKQGRKNPGLNAQGRLIKNVLLGK